LKQAGHEELDHPFFSHDILHCSVWVRFCATTITHSLAKSIST